MLIAITRSPGPELARCELTHLPRVPIDIDRALAQHRAYQNALRRAGVRVMELPGDPALPDGVFVEDTAVVLEEVAILAAPAVSGIPSLHEAGVLLCIHRHGWSDDWQDGGANSGGGRR